MGRDSVDGIATGCSLDDPEIESSWRRDFPDPSRSTLGPTHPSIQWITGPFLEINRTVRSVYYPTPSSAEVKERVQLHLCFSSGSSMPVLGRNPPFTRHIQEESTVRLLK
jgi:hypothetical protein